MNLDTEKRYLYEKRDLSPDMLSKIDQEVKRIVDEGYAEAVRVLKTMKKDLDKLAEALLKKETLEADEFETLMGAKKKITSPFAPKSHKA